METSHRRLTRFTEAAILAFAFPAQCLIAQADELQTTLHSRVEKREILGPQGKDWDAEKKALSKYSQDQIVRSLIVELDLDRGSRSDNGARDMVIHELVQNLHLPPTLFCQELDESESPQRKDSLMTILRGQKNLAVTQVLLRQLKDKRPAVEPRPMYGGHALRVCDVACNALAEILSGDMSTHPIIMAYSDATKDKIIQQTLTQYKLSVPE